MGKDEKYTAGDCADIIENEGVGYAVQHYMDGSNIEDPALARLWDGAAMALNNLVAYIERQTRREL